MSGQDELRDRIAKVHFASSARLAAEQLDLDKPVEWSEITDPDRASLLDSAQAVIDEFGLTVQEPVENYPNLLRLVVGRWN